MFYHSETGNSKSSCFCSQLYGMFYLSDTHFKFELLNCTSMWHYKGQVKLAAAELS